MSGDIISNAREFLDQNGLDESAASIFARKALVECGHKDELLDIICILHGTAQNLRDIERIKRKFGFEIAHAVFVLDKKTMSSDIKEYVSSAFSKKGTISDKEAYRLRIAFANKAIQRVKLAFLLYSVQNLEKLDPIVRKTKIAESQNFYIPLAKKVCPKIGKMISKYVKEYEKKLIENFFLHHSSA